MKSSLQCFLIDDDIDDQKIFSIIAEEIDNSISCLFASDGVDALEKLSGGSYLPDLIFLDVNMPRMDGIECLRKIKATKHLGHIPVFMYSTTADPDTVNLAKKLGARDFIVKPNNITELANLLADIFSREKLHTDSVE
ncbi:MAG: response regulator [Bacteroidetes bacterium]|nr:response regulator [Bacteroidota bacterium]